MIEKDKYIEEDNFNGANKMVKQKSSRRTLLTTIGTGMSLSIASSPVGANNSDNPNISDRITNISYEYEGYTFDASRQNYSPSDEFIFPSIIETSNLDNPLGKYYMYCAPHGTGETKDGESVGIALFYSDTLNNNSWTEHPENPIIPPNWEPHYDVSHISSPHALWIDEYDKLFVYFHGENTATRWATSVDGVNFSYGDVAISAENMPNSSESSYARVYKYAIPNRSNKYTMFFMDNQSGTRHIRMATSKDAKNWIIDSNEVITPQRNHEGNVSGPFFFQYRGNYYLGFHASSDKIFVAEVGRNIDKEKHRGVLAEPTEDDLRIAEPFFIKDDSGTPWLFYNRGSGRTTSSIAYRRLTDTKDGKYLNLFDPSQ